MQFWFLALLINGSTLILRHASTQKHVTVCTDFMESNNISYIGEEQELIQLEQKSCNAM